MGDIFGKVSMSKINNSLNPKTSNIIGYNLNDGLRKWRLSKARIDAGETEIINLNIIGDSISEGQSELAKSIANCDKAYAGRFISAIQAQYSDVGEGFIPNNYPYIGTDARWTYTGTWTTTGAYGWYYSAAAGVRKSVVIGSTASLTFNGTGIVVMANKAEYRGSYDVVIDGGAPETWNTAGTATPEITTYTKTGLANSEHTIVLTTKDSTYDIWELSGAYEIKGTAGIRVNKMAVAGGVASAFVANEVNLLSCIDHFSPKLTIIALGANEYNNQVALATYQANMQILITRAKLFGDVLIASIGHISSASKTIPMADYRKIAYDLAVSNDVAYFGLSERWGDSYATCSDYLTDGVHPTIYGHQDIANGLADILL